MAVAVFFASICLKNVTFHSKLHIGDIKENISSTNVNHFNENRISEILQSLLLQKIIKFYHSSLPLLSTSILLKYAALQFSRGFRIITTLANNFLQRHGTLILIKRRFGDVKKFLYKKKMTF